MKGWSAFAKNGSGDKKKKREFFKGDGLTKEERDKQRALEIEEAKKKMSKWERADYEKIQRHRYYPDGTPRKVPINKKWEKQPDGEYKLVAKTRGRSTGKTSKTPATPDWSKPSSRSHPYSYYNPWKKKIYRSKYFGWEN